MRRFLSLRWLGLHAAMLVIVAGFLALGWWQFRRAAGGNALSWGYTFEWPLFAGFVVVFWIKAMRDELREAQAREGAPTPPAPAVPLPAGLRTGTGAPAGEAQGGSAQDGADEDEELAAYNAYLSRLNAEASRAGARLAGRAARRQAAIWSGRAGREAQPPAAGTPPHMEV
jgi:hypothetical protein